MQASDVILPSTGLRANINIAEDQPEYIPLPGYQNNDTVGTLLIHWKLSWKERLQILWSGSLWHFVMRFRNTETGHMNSLQPIRLQTNEPLAEMREQIYTRTSAKGA